MKPHGRADDAAVYWVRTFKRKAMFVGKQTLIITGAAGAAGVAGLVASFLEEGSWRDARK